MAHLPLSHHPFSILNLTQITQSLAYFCGALEEKEHCQWFSLKVPRCGVCFIKARQQQEPVKPGSSRLALAWRRECAVIHEQWHDGKDHLAAEPWCNANDILAMSPSSQTHGLATFFALCMGHKTIWPFWIRFTYSQKLFTLGKSYLKLYL